MRWNAVQRLDGVDAQTYELKFMDGGRGLFGDLADEVVFRVVARSETEARRTAECAVIGSDDDLSIAGCFIDPDIVSCCHVGPHRGDEPLGSVFVFGSKAGEPVWTDALCGSGSLH